MEVIIHFKTSPSNLLCFMSQAQQLLTCRTTTQKAALQMISQF